MASSIHKMLWGAFAALTILVAAGIALTLLILQNEHAEETRIVAGSEPLIDSMQEMNTAISTAVSAARGYVLTGESQFPQQYDDAVPDFEHNYGVARQIASDPDDIRELNDFHKHFESIKP